MSTIVERAELEAAIAEAELSEEEAGVVKGGVAEGVPVAEAIALVREARDLPEPTAAERNGDAGAVTEAQLAELEKERGAHLRKVKRILGAAGEGLEECEHCDGMGLAPPGEAALEPKPHEFFRACETCNALGQVLTGSHVAGHVARECPDCRGRGYLEALDDAGTPLASGQGAPAAPPVGTPLAGDGNVTMPELAGQEPQRFGVPSWMGNPNLGQ